MYQQCYSGLPQTSPSQQFVAPYPNIWKFLPVLQKEQSLGKAEMERLLAGHPPTPQRKQYQALSHHIKTIVEDYEHCPLVDDLRGISHSLTFDIDSDSTGR